MPANKKHHYVPRMYLKNFADDNGRVAVVVLPDMEPKIASYRELTQRNNLYTLYSKDGDRTLAMEKLLGHLEDQAASVFRRWVTDGGPPLPEDVRPVSLWLSAQSLRGLGTRELMVRAAKDAGIELTPTQLSSSHAIHIFRYLEENAAEISNMAWTLIDTEVGIPTSDQIFCFDPYSTSSFVKAKSVYVPIGRKLILSLSNDPEFNKLARGGGVGKVAPPDFSAAMSMFVFDYAGKIIVHHPDDSPLLGLGSRDPMDWDMLHPTSGLYFEGHRWTGFGSLPTKPEA